MMECRCGPDADLRRGCRRAFASPGLALAAGVAICSTNIYTEVALTLAAGLPAWEVADAFQFTG